MAEPENEEKDFVQKYQGAIIFLGIIFVLSIILLFVYVALKREMCNCFGKKGGHEDDEEGLYEPHSEDEEGWDDLEKDPETASIDDLMIPPDEVPPNDDIPEVVITEAHFESPDKKKKTKLKSMFNRMKKPIKNVRFRSERSSLIEVSQDSGYGTMTSIPLQRSDSMESFMSGVSTLTTNTEEFGEELSPSRIQVFVQYDSKRWVLTVGAKQAQCLISTSKDKMYWQVHMTLMPFKNDKFKSRYKSTSTPIFNQNFEVDKISGQALGQLSVRYRIYGRAGRTGRKKLAGETEVELGMLTQMEDNTIKDWRVLKRKSVTLDKRESEV